MLPPLPRYKRLTTQFEGVLTGKDPKWGGSLLRPEATGYGLVYYLQQMLADSDLKSNNNNKLRGVNKHHHEKDLLVGKRVTVSGSGNVAQYCAEKLIDLGAVVVSLSDSNGCVYEPDGFTKDKLAQVGCHGRRRQLGWNFRSSLVLAREERPKTITQLTPTSLFPLGLCCSLILRHRL
jgi:glutamate dehydrogenase (NADP+)